MKNLISGLLIGVLICVVGYWFYTSQLNQLSGPNPAEETPLVTETPLPTAAPPPAESVEDQIKADIAKKYNISSSEIKLIIGNQTDSHIKGTVSVTDGGGWFLAALTDGSWHLVDDGNGIVSCDKVTPYKFPKTLVPACLDQQGNLINQ